MNITLVGDIFPANLPYNRGLGVASSFNDNSQAKQQRLKRIFNGADIVFGNLESPILGTDAFDTDAQFLGSPLFLEMIREAGVNIVSIANNHIMEQSSKGFYSTIQCLDDCNISYVGEEMINGQSSVTVKDFDGLKLAFVAYNDIDNDVNSKCAKYSKEKVLRSIYSLKQEKVDYIFISLHWGDEYVHKPALWQINDAHSFIDAGATFIIGGHPHVIQPIERYKGGLICYSLGNFIFDMNYGKAVRQGLVLKVTLSKNSFNYEVSYIEIQKDYFPLLKDHPNRGQVMRMSESKITTDSAFRKLYGIRYNFVKKISRLWYRFISKRLLIVNWSKYSTSVRENFRKYYNL